MKPFLDKALATTARLGVAVGTAVARGAARAYHAVDPDVRMHLAQLPLLGVSLIGARSVAVERGEPDGHAPLVFVHGLGGSRGDFMPMWQYLRLHGRKRGYRIGLEERGSVEELAAELARYIERVAEVNEAPQVDVVAHSLGGLVARLAILEHGLAARVATLITLGTPHQGTHTARFADTPTTRRLRPDSDLLQRLGSTPWPSGVRGVSFWSRSDVFVLPPESAALAGTAQLEVTPFTHYSYLIDPRSWVLVREELERAQR